MGNCENVGDKPIVYFSKLLKLDDKNMILTFIYSINVHQ